MKELLVKLVKGVLKKDVPRSELPLIDELVRLKIVKEDGKTYRLSTKYRAGKIDIARNGKGYLEQIGHRGKDLLIEPEHLNGAGRGDLVIARRIFKSGGRPSAKVVFIVQKAFKYSVGVLDAQTLKFINVKTSQQLNVKASRRSLKKLPPQTVAKIDNENGTITEILGVLEDPSVDERISLALYNKQEEFSAQAMEEARSFPEEIDESLYPDRVDLRDLSFCTIDPPTAKDHDDAIFFDINSNTLYVAIADVSEYVYMHSAIDKEAKERGFSIYFPHKAVPMLPKELSEGICSLKPNKTRLAFVCEIELDEDLNPKKEKFYEALIRSKRKYSYDKIDLFLEKKAAPADETDKEILKFLPRLYEITQIIRERRLQKGFEFSNPEIRLELDKNQNLVATHVEYETPSHKLIEECMLLANKAAAKMFEYGIFRTHEEPGMEKIEELLNELATIGIFTKEFKSIHSLFLSIQQEAQKMGIKEHVDRLLIRTQKQAAYTAQNIGHFGLGFKEYTHFTSPIRRYSDLTLHRLLKKILKNDKKGAEYILRNIEPLTVKISELEREAAKVEWDFMDRKFARWAKNHINERFTAVVTDPESTPIAQIEDEIVGARIFLPGAKVELFEKIVAEIVDSDIATTKITAKVIKRMEEDV